MAVELSPPPPVLVPSLSDVPQDCHSNSSLQSHPTLFGKVLNELVLADQTLFSADNRVQQLRFDAVTDQLRLLLLTRKSALLSRLPPILNPVLQGRSPATFIPSIPSIEIQTRAHTGVQTIPAVSNGHPLTDHWTTFPYARANFVGRRTTEQLPATARSIPAIPTLVPLSSRSPPPPSCRNGASSVVTSLAAAECLLGQNPTSSRLASRSNFANVPSPSTTIVVGQASPNTARLTSPSSIRNSPSLSNDGQKQEPAPHVLIDTGTGQTFPMRLHRALAALKLVEGGADIAAFLPHGRSFLIKDQDRFESRVLPEFFPKMSRYPSFQRQLNLYGFMRIGGASIARGAYHHPYFVRDDPVLSRAMRPFKLKRGPKFYELKNKKAAAASSSSFKNTDDNAATAQLHNEFEDDVGELSDSNPEQDLD